MEYKYLYEKINSKAGEDLARDLADNSYQENVDLASELLDMLNYGKHVLYDDYAKEAMDLEKGEKKYYERPFERSLSSLQNCLGLVQELDFIGRHAEVGSAFHDEDYFELLVRAKNMVGVSIQFSPYRSSAKYSFTSYEYRKYLDLCKSYKKSEEKIGSNSRVGLRISLAFQWMSPKGSRPKDLEWERRYAAEKLLTMDPEERSQAAAERSLFGQLEELARTFLEEADKREQKKFGDGQAYLNELGDRYVDMDSDRVREILCLLRDWFRVLGTDYDDAQRMEERARQRYGKEFS